MYIDFHTHAFVDAIADRAIAKLENTMMTSGYPDPTPPVTRGTVGELLEKLDEWEVDRAVVLPIATKPSQEKTINDWAASAMSDKLYFFGTVHPDAEDAFDELERIKALGLKGIKLHPDYQGYGIAKNLLERIKEKYRDFLYIELMPEDKNNVPFYEKHGFEVMEGGTAMYRFKY